MTKSILKTIFELNDIEFLIMNKELCFNLNSEKKFKLKEFKHDQFTFQRLHL